MGGIGSAQQTTVRPYRISHHAELQRYFSDWTPGTTKLPCNGNWLCGPYAMDEGADPGVFEPCVPSLCRQQTKYANTQWLFWVRVYVNFHLYLCNVPFHALPRNDSCLMPCKTRKVRHFGSGHGAFRMFQAKEHVGNKTKRR